MSDRVNFLTVLYAKLNISDLADFFFHQKLISFISDVKNSKIDDQYVMIKIGGLYFPVLIDDIESEFSRWGDI